MWVYDRDLTNREVLASLTLDPKECDVSATSPTEPTVGDADIRRTERIIRCMKRALSHSISSISLPEKQRPLDPQLDFTIKTKLSFGSASSSCCASQSLHGPDDEEDDGEAFTFTDYSPMCYRHIREFFGIDHSGYRDVLCQSKWYSIPTPGKSSAQLFFCGQNWVIKTMNQQESNFLRNILHRYYYHVRDNRFTLLPHFVGHHSLLLPPPEGGKIVFVVMQNVFATVNKIHEKFDLKGSTVGRFATAKEKRKLTCTRKDLDINRPLLIGPKRKGILIAQVKKDCDFLRRSAIMDYSFLLGVHRVDLRSLASMMNKEYEDGRCFTCDQGGMLSVEDGSDTTHRCIYYVGIIDILQEYTLWKRSETLVQGTLHDSHQISSVDPREYSARFVSFITSIVV